MLFCELAGAWRLTAAAEMRFQKLPDLQVRTWTAGPGSEANDFALTLDPQAKVLGARIRHVKDYSGIAGIHDTDLQGGCILVNARSTPVFSEFIWRVKLGGIRSLP